MADPSPRVQLASGELDPQLQVASAPFATWIGVIQVDAGGTAHLLRSTGDEDEYPVDPEIRALVAQALDVEPAVTAWLPVRTIYPVLANLDPADAFDVASRMPAPRAELLVPGAANEPLELHAALVDGVPGWCGGPTAASVRSAP